MKHTIAALGVAAALVSPYHAVGGDRPQGEVRHQVESAAAAPATGSQPQAGFSLPAIKAELRSAGVTFVDEKVLPSGGVIWALQLAGLKFGITAYQVEGNTAKSLQLNAVFSDGGRVERAQKMTAANKWNLDSRFVTAAVLDGDHHNDIMLEMDLIAIGAMEPRAVVRTISDEWMFALMQWATRAH